MWAKSRSPFFNLKKIINFFKRLARQNPTAARNGTKIALEDGDSHGEIIYNLLAGLGDVVLPVPIC